MRVLATTMLCLFGIAPIAEAQQQIVPPAQRPRSGRAAAPTPPPEQTRPTVTQPTYTISAPFYVVQSDGSVVVNYGNGYERALHRCAPQKPTVPADPYARDVFGRIPPPPGIAALQAGSQGTPAGQVPARDSRACYRADAGRIEVVTLAR